MKKFMLALGITAGLTGLLVYLEYRKRVKEEEKNAATTELHPASIMDPDFNGLEYTKHLTESVKDEERNRKAKEANVMKDEATINTDTVQYGGYYKTNNNTNVDLSNIDNGPIRSADPDSKEIELRRMDYQTRHIGDWQERSENEEMDDLELYINNQLSTIDKITDIEIWTAMASLYGYDLHPTQHQEMTESIIIDNMRANRELYMDTQFPTFYGSAGELIMYFAKSIADNLGKSLAGVLEMLLKNGGFLGCIKNNDEYDIEVDSDRLRYFVDMLFRSDSRIPDKCVFGDSIKRYMEESEPEDWTWIRQLNEYIDEELQF